MNNLRTAGRALSVGLRQVHASPNLQVQRSTIRLAEQSNDDGLAKMRLKQIKFQKVDDVPVHLKGGPLDKLLYYFTFGLIGLGFFEGGKFMWVCYTD